MNLYIIFIRGVSMDQSQADLSMYPPAQESVINQPKQSPAKHIIVNVKFMHKDQQLNSSHVNLAIPISYQKAPFKLFSQEREIQLRSQGEQVREKTKSEIAKLGNNRPRIERKINLSRIKDRPIASQMNADQALSPQYDLQIEQYCQNENLKWEQFATQMKCTHQSCWQKGQSYYLGVRKRAEGFVANVIPKYSAQVNQFLTLKNKLEVEELEKRYSEKQESSLAYMKQMMNNLIERSKQIKTQGNIIQRLTSQAENSRKRMDQIMKINKQLSDSQAQLNLKIMKLQHALQDHQRNLENEQIKLGNEQINLKNEQKSHDNTANQLKKLQIAYERLKRERITQEEERQKLKTAYRDIERQLQMQTLEQSLTLDELKRKDQLCQSLNTIIQLNQNESTNAIQRLQTQLQHLQDQYQRNITYQSKKHSNKKWKHQTGQ